MKLKKVFTLLIALVVCLSLVACKKCKNHVDKNDDLKCDTCKKPLDDGPDVTTGCTSHIDNDGDNACDNCGESMGSTVQYEPKWQLNPTNFKGNGMSIKIKCLPVSEFDPFDTNYSGDQRALKMRHQQAVQQAYDVKIEYVAWGENEAWGPTRSDAVINGYVSKNYIQEGYYVVNIASSWIPKIVEKNAIAELGVLSNGEVTEGILANFNQQDGKPLEKYVQNSTINQILSSSEKVFGIATGKPTPDCFIYYNLDLVEAAKVEDPAELWLKGEWTLSKFEEWVEETQTKLESGKKVLDLTFAGFSIGLVASTGNQFIQLSPIQKVQFLETGVTDALKTIQDLYKNGYYTARTHADASDDFKEGNSVLHDGSFWYIKSTERFNVKNNGLRLGVVPYPAADDDDIKVVTSSNEDDAILSADNVTPLMKDGEYVTGLDLSNAKFKIPYTDTSSFSIMNFSNGKNGLSSEIVAYILIDLYAGIGKDPNAEERTEEQAFREYLKGLFGREIDLDVVMSVYDQTYFEIFSAVSMTVGNNSQYGDGAYWPLCLSICTDSSKDPRTELDKVHQRYIDAMKSMGYPYTV